MSAAIIKRRLHKLEDSLCPSHADGFTLEELCRSMWRRDKDSLLKVSENTPFGLFVRQFELEDAERAAQRRRREPSQ